jgi:hypothetical protein
MRTIIVDAINKNTCAEHKPHIKIKHITNVIIDEANKHNDKYLSIHRSYKRINKQKHIYIFFSVYFSLQYIQHQQD